MDLGKIVLFIVVGFVALWVLSFFLRFLAVIVTIAFPVAIIAIIGYFIAKAFGWVKS